jgi:adenylate cyclase
VNSSDGTLTERRVTLANLRTATGLVIGLYVTMHLSNHALGLISVRAQEAVRPWVMALWHSLPGQILLYGSLSSHATVALISLVRRRHYRMPAWEATQILLGLAIPYLLLVHIINTRGTRILAGIDIDYPYEIANLWVDPWTRYRQLLLVLLVWGHFVVGLHFWLRIQAWYQRAFPAILIGYVIVPVAALLGFAEVGMTMTAHARAEPQWMRAMKSRGVPADPRRAQLRTALKEWAPASWLGVVALVFSAAQIRNWQQRHHRFKVTYPDNVVVEAPIGMSVLEVSRMARRPHMSVCGGRARCTTCRVRIDSAAGDLPAPEAIEAHALERIGAPAGVRLACQLRPAVNVAARPLLHPSLVTSKPLRSAQEFGEEREVSRFFSWIFAAPLRWLRDGCRMTLFSC